MKATRKFPDVVVLIMRKRKEMPRWIPSRGIFDQVVGIYESTDLAQRYMDALYEPEMNDLYMITEPVHRSGTVVARPPKVRASRLTPEQLEATRERRAQLMSQRMKEYWRLKKQADTRAAD